MPKPLRFRSSYTPSWCSRTCWRHAGRAAARQHDPNNRGLVSFFWPYTATFYTAKNTAKNRCIALYTDTRCVTALHSYTALYSAIHYTAIQLYIAIHYTTSTTPLCQAQGRGVQYTPARSAPASATLWRAASPLHGLWRAATRLRSSHGHDVRKAFYCSRGMLKSFFKREGSIEETIHAV